MTYEESNTLMMDQAFRGRVKVSVLKYSQHIVNEQPNVEAHSARYRWAQSVFTQPHFVAAQVTPMVVMDPAVQSSGAAVTDTALQVAVETIVNKIL